MFQWHGSPDFGSQPRRTWPGSCSAALIATSAAAAKPHDQDMDGNQRQNREGIERVSTRSEPSLITPARTEEEEARTFLA